MAILKTFFKTSVIYFVGRVLSGTISFFLLPIYTRKVEALNYGYFELSKSIISVIIPVICFEVWTGMMCYVLSAKSESEKRCYLASGLMYLTVANIFFVLMCTIYHSFEPFKHLNLIVLLGCSLSISTYFGYISRANNHNFTYSFSGVIATLSNAITGILSVYYFNSQEIALFLALIVGYMLQSIYLLFNERIWKYVNINLINWNCIKTLLAFGWPLSLNAVLYYVGENLNKVAIKANYGLDSVGIFSVAFKFIVIISLIASVFQYAWQEITFKIALNEQREKLYSEICSMFYQLAWSFTIILLLIVGLVFPVMIDSKYKLAYAIIPVLFISSPPMILEGFLIGIINGERKTVEVMKSRVFVSILTLLAFLIVKMIKLPLISFAYVYCIGKMLVCFYMYRKLQNIMNFKIEFSKSAVMLFLYMIAGYIYMRQENILIIKGIGVLLPSLLFLNKKYIKMGCNYVKNKRR